MSSTSFSRSKGSLGVREFNGWYCLLFCKCNDEDKVFDVAFDHFLTSLKIWEFLQTATKNDNQVHCIVFPTIALTDNLAPNVPTGERQPPQCRPLLACLRLQCHLRSGYPEFCLTVEQSSSLNDPEKIISSCATERHCRLCTSFLWSVSPSLSRYSAPLSGRNF